MRLELDPLLLSSAQMRLLASRLEQPLPTAIGVVVALWTHTLPRSPLHGDVQAIDASGIAAIVGWDQDSRHHLVDALVATGWLIKDDDSVGWQCAHWAQVGAYALRREASRVRMALLRERRQAGA